MGRGSDILHFAVLPDAFHFLPLVLGLVHTIPDSFCIGSLFIADRPSVHTMTLESDTLRIVFAESNHSAVNVEWNHIGSLLSSCERINPIRFRSGTSVSKRQLHFRGF